jgi:hypothetical protein
LWIRLPGTRFFVAMHYTQAASLPQFEIFISWICFFDTPLTTGSGTIGL